MQPNTLTRWEYEDKICDKNIVNKIRVGSETVFVSGYLKKIVQDPKQDPNPDSNEKKNPDTDPKRSFWIHNSAYRQMGYYRLWV